LFERIACAIECATEANVPFAQHVEKQEVFTVSRVIGNCFVALRKQHVALLALSEIAKSAISRPFVGVSVARAATRKEKDNWRVCWRYNSALALAAKPSVNVPAPVVGLSEDKVRCHSYMLPAQPHAVRTTRFALGGLTLPVIRLNERRNKWTGGGSPTHPDKATSL